MINIEPATKEILECFYGKQKRSVFAISAIENGKVVGVAGLYIDTSRFVMFSDLGNEVICNKRLIIKGMRKLKEFAKKKRLPIHAIGILPTADSFLKHMGFVEITKGLYQWEY